MTIQTLRLFIRKFEAADSQNLFELDSDSEVMKFISGKKPQSIADSTIAINRQLAYYEKHKGLGIFPAVLADTNEFIGWCALKLLDTSDKIEVGYRLKKRFWGKGYATELTKALLKYGFENLNLKEIYAVTHPNNSASQNVLIKSGLKLIGTDTYYNNEVSLFRIENKSST